MHDSITSMRKAIRQVVFDHAGADDSFCFSFTRPVDASANRRGDLFEQNGDFFIVETMVDETRRAGPGVHSPKRLWGGLEIRWLTKDSLDELGARERLEQIGAWFEQETLHGIRFREFLPNDNSGGALLGFYDYWATVPFECEIKAKGA